uniref:Uncharacterized protein n=1 Tax=Cyclopterus lumpus TaxID=8103 RepID=A0A8C2WSI8_CYCLU
MAEDHGLGDGDGSVDVTEGVELLLPAVAQHIVLFDGVQRLLLPLQLDDVGVGHNALGEAPHRLFKRGREQQHLAVFRQHPEERWHKHHDLLGVYELEFPAPVQHGTRCTNNYLQKDDDVASSATSFGFVWRTRA